MARKTRFAAILFLATTVLAAGGVGVWYFMANGWTSLAGLVPADGPARLEGQDASQSQAASFADGDLDSVAGAWAEPASTRPASSSGSSAMARSAAVVQTLATDRYALPSESAAPLDSPPKDIASDAAQPMPATEAQLEALEPIVAEQRPSSDVPARGPNTDSDSDDALTRGQEPKEEPNRDDLFASSNENTEPRPLNTSAQEDGIVSAANHVRESLRERSAPAAGDRYDGATPSEETGNSRTKNRLDNPFDSKPPSNAVADSAPESIGPLPALPDENEGRTNGLRQAGNQEGAGGTDQTARAAAGNPPRDLPAGQHVEPLDGQSTPDFGAPPSSANSGPQADRVGQPSASDGTGQPGERALEGPQKPALEIQKFAPPEIQVGKPAKFMVQIRNVGNQAADGVTIRDEVPHGTRLVSTSPTAESEGGQIVWQLGKLSPGEDRTVEMQLMPTSEGEIGSVATVSYSAQASVKTRCTMPQLAIRMTAPSKVMIGQEQRVKIELRNPGSGDATGVMLFENVPQNVKHAAGPALEFDIGTLRAGETRELELVLLAEKPGKTVNVLSARAEGNLQVQQQVEFEVIAPALTVDVNGPERRYLERPATYEVSVENPGTAPAQDVQIITKLPKGLQFVRANNMGEYDAANHAVYWSLAELPEGERGTVELVAMPIETGPQTLHVESRAGQGLSDQAQRQIVVDGLAAILFEVRDLEDPIEVGGETGYEIRVVNQGTKAATNVQIAVNLPAGMRLVSAEGETQHAEQRGAIVFEPIPQLAPKADTLYRVRVQGTAAGDQRVTVEVNTDDLAQPIRREESTRVFGDE